MEIRLSPPNGDDAGERARPGADGMAIIAGLDDPHPVLLADDLADMVGPDHYRANTSRPGLAPADPAARQIERRARVAADELPHLPPAPGAGTAARMAGSGARPGKGIQMPE